MEFNYLEPERLEEACSLLSRHKENAKLLAGGQSLLIVLKEGMLNPEYIIDVKNLKELSYIKDDGDLICIGAMTTQREIEKSKLLMEELPILPEMAKQLCDVQIRNWGTLGGNLCHADPTADPAPALMALGASLKVCSVRGERVISINDFFKGFYATALEPDEILTEIQIPKLANQSSGVYKKESKRPNHIAVASVAAVVEIDNSGVITSARIALGGVGETVINAKTAAEALIGSVGDEDTLKKVGEAASKEAQPVSDLQGTEDYKRTVVARLVKEVVAQAICRCARKVGQA